MLLEMGRLEVQIICNGLCGREYSANQNAPFIDKAGVGYDYHYDEVLLIENGMPKLCSSLLSQKRTLLLSMTKHRVPVLWA
jgi:hypothetical protein